MDDLDLANDDDGDEKDSFIGGSAHYGGIGSPAPVPERTPEHFVCLRGPCRHYWHLVTTFQAGNPAGTFEALGIPAPRQHHHVCLRSGEETDFTDDCAFECNQWDPLTESETTELEARRQDWRQRYGR